MNLNFFKIDPLSKEFLHEFIALNDFVFLEELKIIQNSLIRSGWNHFHIEKIIEILDQLRIQAQLSLKYFEVSQEEREAPIITFQLMNLILEHFFEALLLEIEKYGYIEQTIAELYSIVFLVNVFWWKQISRGIASGNLHFWIKSATLLFETFNSERRTSISSLRCRMSWYKEGIHIKTENEFINQLSTHRTLMIFKESCSTKKNGKKKDESEYGILKEKAREFYFQNKTNFKNGSRAIEAIRQYLKENAYFGCKRISEEERGDKTIRSWIKSWKNPEQNDFRATSSLLSRRIQELDKLIPSCEYKEDDTLNWEIYLLDIVLANLKP